MPFLYSTAKGGRGIFSGGTFTCKNDFTEPKRIYQPLGVSNIQRYGIGKLYGRRLYICGHFSENVVVDEDLRMWRQGMRAPTSPPSVSVGGGTDVQRCYVSVYDERTTERSSLSEGFDVTGNTTRVWTLPTQVSGELFKVEGTATASGATLTGDGIIKKTNFDMIRPGDRIAGTVDPNRVARIRAIIDAGTLLTDDAGIGLVAEAMTLHPVRRATHWETWVAVGGTLPRLSARVPIGVTTFTESTPTLSLGEAFLESFLPMPCGTMNAIYADRQAVAGVDRNMDTVYLSTQFFPERWHGLSFRTRYGEPIVALIGTRDYLLVLCPDSSYILQGYLEDDLTFMVSDPDLGGIGHAVNLLIRGSNAYIPNRKGYWLNTGGSWKQLIQDRHGEFMQAVEDHRRPFEEGLAAHNPKDQTIQLVPKYRTSTNLGEKIWVADYSSVRMDGGGEISPPNWADDDWEGPTQIGTTGSGHNISSYWQYLAYLVPSGAKSGKFYRVSFNGTVSKIYVEDPAVALGQKAVLRPAFCLFDEYRPDTVGGQEGWELDELWSYVVSEDSSWRVNVWMGDEYAAEIPGYVQTPGEFNVVRPIYRDDVDASLKESLDNIQYYGGTTTYRRWAKKTVHIHRPAVSGRGMALEYIFNDPKAAKFLGFGGSTSPGKAFRGLVAVSIQGV